MASKSTAGTSTSKEFTTVFRALRAILVPYTKKRARVAHDTPTYYYVETTFPILRGKPTMFAAVRRGKSYVSYHLLPLYMNPRLQGKVPAELKRRQQGKACFNFAQPDRRLFAALSRLSRLAWADFEKLGRKEAAR